MIIINIWIRFELEHWYTNIPSSTKVNFSCGANIQDNILMKIKIWRRLCKAITQKVKEVRKIQRKFIWKAIALDKLLWENKSIQKMIVHYKAAATKFIWQDEYMRIINSWIALEKKIHNIKVFIFFRSLHIPKLLNCQKQPYMPILVNYQFQPNNTKVHVYVPEWLVNDAEKQLVISCW